MKIIISGPPGSGKGTQTRLLKKYLNIDVISVGDILRDEISKKTVIGLEIKHIIENGFLINDDIIFSILKDKFLLNENFILDGMPRTLNQSLLFDKLNINFDFFFNIKLDDSVLIKRIKYRLISENSKDVFNVIYNRPKIKNLDDSSGQILNLRRDDVLSVVINRIHIYNFHLNQIIDFYKSKNTVKVFDIDGNNKIDNVFLRIKSCIL